MKTIHELIFDLLAILGSASAGLQFISHDESMTALITFGYIILILSLAYLIVKGWSLYRLLKDPFKNFNKIGGIKEGAFSMLSELVCAFGRVLKGDKRGIIKYYNIPLDSFRDQYTFETIWARFFELYGERLQKIQMILGKKQSEKWEEIRKREETFFSKHDNKFSLKFLDDSNLPDGFCYGVYIDEKK